MKDLRSTWSKVYELIGVEEYYQNFGRQREAYTLDRVGKGTWNGAAHEGTGCFKKMRLLVVGRVEYPQKKISDPR